MVKLLVALSVLILWLHSLLSSLLNMSLEPFKVTNIFYIYVPWVIIIPAILIYFLKSEAGYITSPQERWRQDDEFEQEVIDLELEYKGDIKGLKSKTFLIALLGYAAVFGVIAFVIMLGLGAAFVVGLYASVNYWIYLLALPHLYVAFKLIKTLYVGRSGTRGVEITKQQCPKLFLMLKRIQEKARGPKFKKVFIDMEMNASVSRSSGFLGSIGFGRVTLNLGLPLMQSLSVKQLAAVIAHEYGHVAARDNAMSHWIYRVRESWLEMDEVFNKERIWILFLGRFYSWFFQTFKIYSFALSRDCEYKADKFAVDIVGKTNMAEALILVEFCAEKLNDEYWSKLWDKAKEMPKPAFAPYSHLKEKVQEFDLSKEKLKKMLSVKPDYKGTHPVLPKRIGAIGKKVKEVNVTQIPASDMVLGEGVENSLTFLFDKTWRHHIASKWGSIYSKHQRALAYLADFSIKKIARYSMEELQEALSFAHAAEDDDVIISICDEVLKRDEDNSYAKLNLYGYSLVHDNRAENLVKLDELVAEYPEYIAPASYFAIRYLEMHGWHEEAKIYRYRLDDWEYKKHSADEERGYIFEDDILVAHSMQEKYIYLILKILESEPSVAKAWMISKETQYFRTTPFFPIILQRSVLSFADREKVKHRIENSIKKQGLARYCRIFWIDEVKGSKARIKHIPNSLIYQKK